MAALVPSAKNDEFALPDSEIYILTVPFTSDYKHVINFANKTAQIDAFKSYMDGKDHLHFTKCDIIRKERSLILRQPFGQLLQQGNDMYQFNYMIYQNPNLDNKWWYCFIDNCEYRAKDTVEIFFSVDVWQTFHTDITYRKCMIERCHIPRANDSFRLWNEPEPLTVIPYGESDNLNILNQNIWDIKWYLKTLSIPKPYSGSEYFCTFRYGGTLENEVSMSSRSIPYYLLDVETFNGGGDSVAGKYNALLNTYNKIFSDHRQDVIEFTGVPFWVYLMTNFDSSTLLYIHEPRYKYVDPQDKARGVLLDFTNTSTASCNYVGRNDIANTTVAMCTMNTSNFTVSGNTYTPRNKKLFSSLCKMYAVYNHAGLKILIKPEDIIAGSGSTANLISIKAEATTMDCNAIKFSVNTLRRPSENFLTVPYDAKMSVAYNENSGATLAVNAVKNVLSIGTSIASLGLAGDTGSGFINALSSQGAALRRGYKENKDSGSSGWSFKQKSNKAQQAYNAAYLNKQENELTSVAINGAEDLFGGGMTLGECLSNVTSGTSSIGDLYGARSHNMAVYIREITPTMEQLRECDDFLDIYGYARNEILPLGNNIATRSNWNYVKTVNCNLTCNCSTNYENALRTIFNNGVTIWHSFAKLISGYNSLDSDDKNQ